MTLLEAFSHCISFSVRLGTEVSVVFIMLVDLVRVLALQNTALVSNSWTKDSNTNLVLLKFMGRRTNMWLLVLLLGVMPLTILMVGFIMLAIRCLRRVRRSLLLLNGWVSTDKCLLLLGMSLRVW